MAMRLVACIRIHRNLLRIALENIIRVLDMRGMYLTLKAHILVHPSPYPCAEYRLCMYYISKRRAVSSFAATASNPPAKAIYRHSTNIAGV